MAGSNPLNLYEACYCEKTPQHKNLETETSSDSRKGTEGINKPPVAAAKSTEQVESVRVVRERFGESRKIVKHVVGLSERSIADCESENLLSEVWLQRMREMARVQKALSGVA